MKHARISIHNIQWNNNKSPFLMPIKYKINVKYDNITNTNYSIG